MGKVEKVVVLSVLFLITLILVVSLSSSPESPAQREERMASRGPAAADLVVELGEPEPAPAARAAAQPKLLSAVVESAPAVAPEPPAPAAEAAPATPPEAQPPAGLPAGAILVTSEGLTPSYLPEYRFYTWEAGDSWESVARRCYGSAERVGLLRQENEGRATIQPGEKILVPVFAPSGAAQARPRAAAGPAAAGGGYVVEEGDSLWKIAKKVYGSGARWEEIYAANRDLLPSPDALATGQRLRIP